MKGFSKYQRSRALFQSRTTGTRSGSISTIKKNATVVECGMALLIENLTKCNDTKCILHRHC